MSVKSYHILDKTSTGIVYIGIMCFPSLGYTDCIWRVIRHIHKTAKRNYSNNHVCPSTWNNLVLIGRIVMKFDIWVFF